MPVSWRFDKIPRYVVLAFFAICSAIGISVIFTLVVDACDPSLSKNLAKIAEDKHLLSAVKNTFKLFLISTVLQIFVAIIVTIHFQSVYSWLKPLLVAPFAMGVVAPAISMLVLFSSAIGPFQLNLLGTAYGGTFIIVLIDTWQWLGVLLLASFLAIEPIPKAHFEQAQLERISKFRRWWLVARPELQIVMLFYVGVRLIDWIRKVDTIRAMFGEGGPENFAETIGIYIAKTYYQWGNKGYASLLSLLQVIVLGLFLAILTLRFRGSRNQTLRESNHAEIW